MKSLITFDWMFFGVARLAEAAERRGAVLHLLAENPDVFSWDVQRSGSSGPVMHKADIDDPEDVERVLAEIGPVDGVIHPVEEGVTAALRVAGERGLARQNAEAVRLVRDKMKLRQHLFSAGLSAGSSVPLDPDNADWDDTARLVGTPFIVKDRAGSGSHDVWLVRGRDDLDAIRRERPRGRLLAEPYFIGPLYSAETISWNGETRLLGVSGRVLSAEPHFREEVFTFPVQLPLERTRRLDEWIKSVLGSISYTSGFAHTEFIITDTGFEVVEINPRIPGGPCGENFSEVLGSDLYEAFADMALGIRPHLLDEPLEARGGIANAVLYPPRAGVFERIDGTETLDRHEGSIVLHRTRETGARMGSVHDLWGAVAILSARGETAEIAMLNALSAMRGLSVRTRDEQH
ncbi:ATP-grasp domain-containing protein [Streptomyces sp. NBC_01716]|uniref:ATP-grasp domain-containing protein n=1 Tax=Streptomyces sp. NBC_01716 TaxID=2975917 RepID=UPI002E37A928|nr:ATP-grasp domain-containing protein [Streptomyces sp. NBC_01716]